MKDNENSIITIEQGEIKSADMAMVTRTRVAGANQFGRPEVNEIGSKTFTSLVEAINWCSEAPEYSHSFEIPIQNLSLSGELYGPRIAQQEMIAIKHNGNSGESPRMVDNHHGVSAHPDTRKIITLNIFLDHSQNALFDRGLAWITLNDPNTLLFSINAGVHTPDEIKEGLSQMTLRVNQVLSDLVRGMIRA